MGLFPFRVEDKKKRDQPEDCILNRTRNVKRGQEGGLNHSLMKTEAWTWINLAHSLGMGRERGRNFFPGDPRARAGEHKRE